MLGLLQVQEVLAYVEERNLLPPMVVLQALAKNPHLTLAVVKGYIERQLTQVRWHVEHGTRAGTLSGAHWQRLR